MNINICRPVEAFETDIIQVRINETGYGNEKTIFLYGLNPKVIGIIKLSKFKKLLPDYDPDSLLGCRCSFSGYLNAGPSINIKEIRV